MFELEIINIKVKTHLKTENLHVNIDHITLHFKQLSKDFQVNQFAAHLPQLKVISNKLTELEFY